MENRIETHTDIGVMWSRDTESAELGRIACDNVHGDDKVVESSSPRVFSYFLI